MSSFSAENFGRYYLVDKIAVGGMAEVFKAKSFAQGGFEKLLVIKRILQHLSGNDEFVSMFIDEAKISVELQHPNIVQIYDFGRIRENYFIAMECVEGKDVKSILRKLAERRKLFTPEYAVYVAHEVCKGLSYAHKKSNLQGEALGIVHRDISPSNILVSYNGEVKIADFGIAKAQTSAYNTKDGVLKGKFEYMSPEQASGESIGHASDIFSTGIILHEMLTGRRLFKTDSEIRTLEKVKAVDIQPPSALNSSVVPRLDDIVMKALSKRPEDRFADAREMQAALLEHMYPATADITRENLAHFMRELFSAEMDTERNRLEAGTRMANEMWESAPEIELSEEWAEEPGMPSSGTMERAPSRLPIVALGVLGTIVMFLLGSWLLWPSSEPDPATIDGPAISSGILNLEISPATEVRIFLDGNLIGNEPIMHYGDVTPGMGIPLRIEADGYETYEIAIDIESEERLRLPITLQAAPTANARSKTKPIQSVPKTPNFGTVYFSTRPSGAEIIMNGSLVGHTPMTWTDGIAGQVYRIEYKLSNYKSDSFSLTFPQNGKSSRFARSLSASALKPGKVSVNVRSGWAEVYIDGTKIDVTPLYNHTLTAGKHTIRVKNEQSGLDSEKVITIGSDKLTRVNF